MDAGRDAALLGLFCEVLDPLSDLVQTLRSEASRGTNMLGETGSVGRSSSSFSVSYAFVTRDSATRVISLMSSTNRERPLHRGPVDADRGDDLDGPASKQILVLGAPEELARLVADRIGEVERAGQPAHFAQAVGEIPFCFRPPATTGLLPAHSRESPSLLPGDLVPLRVGAATDLRRQVAIVTDRSEWGTRSLALLVVRSPLWSVIDSLFVDDQATVLADRFDRVRGTS
jgi:hypothetical protein